MTASRGAGRWGRRAVRLAALAVPLLMPAAAAAQSLSLDLGGGGGGSETGRIIQLVALLTVLSVAPSILIMVTSFTRIVVVLSFLRSALGIQQTPPNTVLISLALFLTLFIMTPTFQRSYDQGILPLVNEQVSELQGFKLAAQPFHDFMMRSVREKDLALFMDISKTPTTIKPADIPYQVLIPAFMISELKRAFEIGFLLFLPFLIIDMVVASILMSMGMMMVPPSTVSLPFKIIFFVLVDGWYLVTGSLVHSFGL